MKKFCFFCLFFLLSFSVFALRVGEGKFVLQLAPGESYRRMITLENPTQKEVKVKAYLEDFSYTSPYDGTKDFYPPGSRKNSLADWLIFSPHQFTLEPYGRRQISINIEPDRSFDTTHSGVLFFETPLGGGSELKGAGLLVRTRVGTLIFVEPKERKKKADFNQLREGIYKMQGFFSNSGNTLLTPEATFYILDRRGIVQERGRLADLYMLPGDNTEIDLPVSRGLSAGRYTMVVNFDLEEGDLLLKEIDFSLDASGYVNILEVRD